MMDKHEFSGTMFADDESDSEEDCNTKLDDIEDTPAKSSKKKRKIVELETKKVLKEKMKKSQGQKKRKKMSMEDEGSEAQDELVDLDFSD